MEYCNRVVQVGVPGGRLPLDRPVVLEEEAEGVVAGEQPAEERDAPDGGKQHGHAKDGIFEKSQVHDLIAGQAFRDQETDKPEQRQGSADQDIT